MKLRNIYYIVEEVGWGVPIKRNKKKKFFFLYQSSIFYTVNICFNIYTSETIHN